MVTDAVTEWPTESEFRLQIRTARRALGISQAELCDALRSAYNVDLPQGALSFIESGKRRISFTEAIAMSRLLGLLGAERELHVEPKQIIPRKVTVR